MILTGDGSHSVRLGLEGPTYHSLHGAVTESRHIYQETGLKAYLAARIQIQNQTSGRGNQVRILEIGLGTGLNAALALETSLEHPRMAIKYTALEPFPLSTDLLMGLNYGSFLKGQAWQVWSQFYPTLHERLGSLGQGSWSWGDSDAGYSLRVLGQPWPCSLDEPVDLVFWDAFGPSYAPELWDERALDFLDRWAAPGAWLVTFGASGAFGRFLKGLGWEVQRLPGPPGKREIIRAKKP
ncbi:MAG: hypothetical protein EBR22_04945 [Cytophagia bacterium]|nr:hypothetical protein [Cytophagia bacterium]